MIDLTREQAELLAKRTRHRARCIRGNWVVWCDVSDHAVEFDRADLIRVGAMEEKE